MEEQGLSVGEWTDVTLGDVLTLQRGFDITRKELREGSVPVVSSSGIAYHHDEAKVPGPGVVVGRKGSLGTVHFLEEPFWPHDTTLWVKDFKGNDPYFCYLLLKTLRLEELDVGAANPTLNRNHAHQLRVMRPDLESQRRIGAVISACDRLIRVSKRRIEILDELAQSLYREWVVHFRFPGSKRGGTDTAKTAVPPVRWSEVTLSTVARITMGQAPKSEFYNDDGFGLPFHQGVSDFGNLLPVHAKFCTAAIRTAEPFDVLCSVRAPVGRLNIADQRLGIGRGVSAIRRTDCAQALLLLQLRQALGKVDSIGGGTIYKAVGKAELADLPIVEPEPELVSAFEQIVRPMLDIRIELTLQIRQLEAARDLLLPRLVTGQLDISHIDLDVLTPSGSE